MAQVIFDGSVRRLKLANGKRAYVAMTPWGLNRLTSMFVNGHLEGCKISALVDGAVYMAIEV